MFMPILLTLLRSFIWTDGFLIEENVTFKPGLNNISLNISWRGSIGIWIVIGGSNEDRIVMKLSYMVKPILSINSERLRLDILCGCPSCYTEILQFTFQINKEKLSVSCNGRQLRSIKQSLNRNYTTHRLVVLSKPNLNENYTSTDTFLNMTIYRLQFNGHDIYPRIDPAKLNDDKGKEITTQSGSSNFTKMALVKKEMMTLKLSPLYLLGLVFVLFILLAILCLRYKVYSMSKCQMSHFVDIKLIKYFRAKINQCNQRRVRSRVPLSLSGPIVPSKTDQSEMLVKQQPLNDTHISFC